MTSKTQFPVESAEATLDEFKRPSHMSETDFEFASAVVCYLGRPNLKRLTKNHISEMAAIQLNALREVSPDYAPDDMAGCIDFIQECMAGEGLDGYWELGYGDLMLAEFQAAAVEHEMVVMGDLWKFRDANKKHYAARKKLQKIIELSDQDAGFADATRYALMHWIDDSPAWYEIDFMLDVQNRILRSINPEFQVEDWQACKDMIEHDIRQKPYETGNLVDSALRAIGEKYPSDNHRIAMTNAQNGMVNMVLLGLPKTAGIRFKQCEHPDDRYITPLVEIQPPV